MKPVEQQISWEESVRWLKSQPDKSDIVRACFFDDPLSEAAARYYQSSEWVAVRHLIGSGGGKALDVGSGRGISAYALARDGWHTTALEPDPSEEVGTGAIRRLASETGVSIYVVEEWGEELPFPSSSFDLVHCRQVLHHARDLPSFCREASRVLKPQGLFIATREHVLSRKEDLQTFLESHALHFLYGGEHAYLLDEYLAAIGNAGITVTNVFNPLESDINLFPSSITELKARIARRFFLPLPGLIPGWILSMRGRSMDQAGRLYSFLGRKP